MRGRLDIQPYIECQGYPVLCLHVGILVAGANDTLPRYCSYGRELFDFPVGRPCASVPAHSWRRQ